MLRVTTVWTGITGAPGYTNHYFGAGIDGAVSTQAEASAVTARVRTFWNEMVTLFPAAAQLTVQPTVAVINPATGTLENEYAVTPSPAFVQGTAVGNYAAPAGACINWRTNAIVRGRRLRGKTFLVPLGASSYFTDGTLISGALTTINTAATNLTGAAIGVGEALVVWARPVNGAGGSVGRAISGSAADKVAILRSRRD